MSLFPIFGIRTLLLLVAPVFLAAVILTTAGRRGTGVFKKQGAAWVITGVMILCAVGIGYARAPIHNPAPEPYLPSGTIPPASAASLVWDEVDVLGDEATRALDQRNQRLWERHRVSIGVVTCNYGGDDMYEYALKRAEEMGLGGYDMIVVLDLAGDNYYLLQGNDISRDFTDENCSDYAREYLEYWFDRGFYSDAALGLTEALEIWYGNYFS